MLQTLKRKCKPTTFLLVVGFAISLTSVWIGISSVNSLIHSLSEMDSDTPIFPYHAEYRPVSVPRDICFLYRELPYGNQLLDHHQAAGHGDPQGLWLVEQAADAYDPL